MKEIMSTKFWHQLNRDKPTFKIYETQTKVLN